MKNIKKGKQRIPVINNEIYSQLLFQIALGNNYAQKISKSISKPTSIIVRQLDILRKEDFVTSEYKEDKSVFPMQRLTLYSVNWKKIIEEFIKYLNENIDYVCSENERLGLGLANIIKGFEVRVKQIQDKKFQEDIKKNQYLQVFFQSYYSEIGRLKENWTIKATFDFISFFGHMNFIYQFQHSHDFYNIEKALYITNQSEKEGFPEWLFKEKKPKTDKEEFERYKKIHKHTQKEFKELEDKREKQVKDIMNKNKEIVELYVLDRILQVVKIKPSLQVGLNKAVKETGKEIFKQALDKEMIKKYYDIVLKYDFFIPPQDKEIIGNDLKEITQENGLNATKPTENKENMSGNTNQIKPLSSINEQGESSK